MLVSFSVRNFGPYADGATLMMVPGGGRLKGDHVYDGLLRHAVVYGANAAGKTRLADAVSMLRGLCTDPLFHTESAVHGWDSDDEVTSFEVRFTVRDDMYRYTLDVEPSRRAEGVPVTYRTVGESLHVSSPMGDERPVFAHGPAPVDDGGKLGRLLAVDRDVRYELGALMSRRDMASLEQGEVDVEVRTASVVSPMADGEVLRDLDARIDDLLSTLRSNRSVMESLVRGSHSVPAVLSRDLATVPRIALGDLTAEDASYHAAEVRRWMSSSLRTLDGDLWLPDLRTLSAVVSSLDIGIDGLLWRRMDGRRAFETVGLLEPGQRIRLEEMRRMAEEGRFDASLDLASDRGILRFFTRMGSEPEVLELCCSENGNVWPVSSESDGTRRIIRIAAMVSPHNSDMVLLIDEFDRGLHPMMTWRLVELFGSIPAPSCQLVATTHDTGLMTTALLRRDEIWLVEKEDGVSHLTSMDDLRLRASEDLERSYLDGRLPGAPRIGDVRP